MNKTIEERLKQIEAQVESREDRNTSEWVDLRKELAAIRAELAKPPAPAPDPNDVVTWPNDAIELAVTRHARGRNIARPIGAC